MPPVSGTSTASPFDEFVETYEEACGRGLSLSGETRDYFAQQRVLHTQRLCSSGRPIRRIVDFGCGLGHTTPYLVDAFPAARVVGVDTSAAAVAAARQRYADARVEFMLPEEENAPGSVDLVYTNGTFHHIEPEAREREVQRIFEWLAPGGLFALWENNPWNPGTRIVMKRIPFDRDAKPLSYLTATRLLERSGFRVRGASSYFYFPSWLRALRPLESRLQRLPLGAQYCVVAERG